MYVVIRLIWLYEGPTYFDTINIYVCVRPLDRRLVYCAEDADVRQALGCARHVDG